MRIRKVVFGFILSVLLIFPLQVIHAQVLDEEAALADPYLGEEETLYSCTACVDDIIFQADSYGSCPAYAEEISENADQAHEASHVEENFSIVGNMVLAEESFQDLGFGGKITAKMCRETCYAHTKSRRYKAACDALCRLLKNCQCTGLESLCVHLGRHGQKKMVEVCLITYNAICI